MQHGGKLLADQLSAFGVRRVFSVPGESFLAALDGLYDSGIENIVCRQEGGAAMMAEAHGKMTGTPGVCFVTRGPGASNASAGIHIAQQDSTPMVLFVGQIARDHRDREAFQEVDYRAMFGGLAKWVAEVDQTDRLAEYIGRAFQVAMSGRPGPVVLALPEDMLSAVVEAVPLRAAVGEVAPDLGGAAVEIMARVAQAKRPLVVVGGPLFSQKGVEDLARFATAQGLPVALGFRRQDYMNNRHPNYVGDLNVGVNPKLAQRVRDADLLLVIGSRLGDIETQGYTLIDPVRSDKAIVHVHRDGDEIGRVFATEMGIVAGGAEMIAALADQPSCGADWSDWTASARADYESWIVPAETPGDVKLEEVIAHLTRVLPGNSVLTNGAGNYAAWLHRYYGWTQHGTQLAPTSGSMGYGFPAAISAAIEHRDRAVVCLAGDGCFQMSCNEMSTAVQYGANLVVIVVNNGRYGTIRMHQEKTYPGRVSGTMLANPDFAALAVAYGGAGECVTQTADFPAALERALAFDGPSIIELRVDVEALAPGATLSGVRAAAS